KGAEPILEIGAAAYVQQITELLSKVAQTQAEPVRQAAALITESLRQGGVINAFGSGHSEAIAMEIAGRAGGLVPSNRLALRDVVIYGGEPTSVLGSTELERDPSIAQRIYDLAPVEPQDVFVLISSSGVNGSVVELASIVKDRGQIGRASCRERAWVPVDAAAPDQRKCETRARAQMLRRV